MEAPSGCILQSLSRDGVLCMPINGSLGNGDFASCNLGTAQGLYLLAAGQDAPAQLCRNTCRQGKAQLHKPSLAHTPFCLQTFLFILLSFLVLPCSCGSAFANLMESQKGYYGAGETFHPLPGKFLPFLVLGIEKRKENQSPHCILRARVFS